MAQRKKNNNGKSASGDAAINKKGNKKPRRVEALDPELARQVEHQLLQTLLARFGDVLDLKTVLTQAGLAETVNVKQARLLVEQISGRASRYNPSGAKAAEEVEPLEARPVREPAQRQPEPARSQPEAPRIAKPARTEARDTEVEAPKYKAQYGKEYIGTLVLDKTFGMMAQVAEIGDISLPAAAQIRAFHGDRVRVRLDGEYRGRPFGSFMGVENLSRREFVGTIDASHGGHSVWFVPQYSKIRPEFMIPEGATKEAKHGDKVMARLTRWTGKKPEGEVLQVLGEAGTHATEMHAIILEFGLLTTFSKEAIEESEKIKAGLTKAEIAKRRDFRDTTTFTIDPVDAKDFDDALSFHRLADGNLEIGVHIADVSHYVKPGTALDNDAFERATSVYLVDRTIPMLPERLSNDLCSLVPNKERPVFSAVFTMTPAGQIVKEWFGRGVIYSDRRFSYEEVQEVLDAREGDYAAELLELNRLAYILRDERFAQGSINFETEEVKFKLDEQFRPIEVFRKERKDAHKLIEDFMLLANRRVAEFVAKARKKPPVPMVFRIHDVPNDTKINTLKAFVSTFGYKFDTTDGKRIAKSINRLVLESVGKPEENLIQTVAIRSMPKAIYTVDNAGHYGLGFEFYTHFTSPIRRYPDVLAHRILQAVLDGNLDLYSAAALETYCKHSSDREKRAADAERASIKYKQVEYLDAHLGEVHEGMISGVTDWGMYIELEGNKCEGMIPLRDLRDDHYELDEKNYRLVGRRTGRTFQLGDRVRVKVSKTNLVKRTADFKFMDKLPQKETHPEQATTPAKHLV